MIPAPPLPNRILERGECIGGGVHMIGDNEEARGKESDEEGEGDVAGSR